MSQSVLDAALHVFEPQPAKPRYYLEYGDLWSDKMFIASNPPMGAYLHYWLREYSDEPVKISIANSAGHVVIELDGTNRPGLNRVVWDLQPDAKQRLANPHNLPEFVPAGEYAVTITMGERTAKTTLTVRPAPGAEPKE
jgi:hypothetical protein